ncbi:unnamed protein product [Pleuronectes platessa]|uniref:Uncharacterized protein n=1 Tax=Pleuronectes platessa TaxID=8262 RepID=A0A9N7VFR6_PLEPL|nr:unnamed protein product [Pleuronectes platessa]
MFTERSARRRRGRGHRVERGDKETHGDESGAKIESEERAGGKDGWKILRAGEYAICKDYIVIRMIPRGTHQTERRRTRGREEDETDVARSKEKHVARRSRDSRKRHGDRRGSLFGMSDNAAYVQEYYGGVRKVAEM